jgi:hypothetical protein
MSRQDPPHAGLLRSVYFLCIAVVSLFAAVTGVFGFYHDPDDEPSVGFTSGFFSPGVFVDVDTIETDIDHLLAQASQDNVYSIQVLGDTVRYELYSASTIYEATMPEGRTIDDLFDEAGIDTSNIAFIDDSLAGQDVSQATGGGDGDYERNIMIILGAIASALFAAAVLGLGRRFNPLRAGLLGGGAIIFLVAMVHWGDASNDWLGFVVALVTFGVLAGTFPFLEDGLPLSAGGTLPPPPPGTLAFTPGPPEPPSFTPPPPPSAPT